MATAKKPAADNAAPSGSKFGKTLILLLVLILLVALIAGGAVIWLLLQKKSDLAGDAGVAEAAPAAQLAAPGLPPVFVNLDPFVVNLQPESGERYLQAVLAVRVDGASTSEAMQTLMPEIRHRINQRLSGKLPSEVSTPPGREQLAQEIVTDISEALGVQPGNAGPVRSVLFSSFIIQ